MPSRDTSTPMTDGRRRGQARDAIIAAAHQVIRQQGYAATSVDDICRSAGVTKGAFFHHFASKDALAVAAADAWTERARPLFDLPQITTLADPLDRVLAHIDMRLSMLDGPVEGFSCFVGTMVQEAYASSEAIRAACDASISAYCARLAEDIAEAIAERGAADGVSAENLAAHIQAVLQGSFILAKTKGDPAIARDSVTHLKRYIMLLFKKEVRS
jgi:TetR/AcrR family transcriptional regulator, transcriptional repressor for nem operon